jgi:hypothetical protein
MYSQNSRNSSFSTNAKGRDALATVSPSRRRPWTCHSDRRVGAGVPALENIIARSESTAFFFWDAS